MNDDIETLYEEFYRLNDDVRKLYKLNDKLSSKIDNFTKIEYKVTNLESEFDNLSDWSREIDLKINDTLHVDNLNNKCEKLEKEVESLKAEIKNKSSNNYPVFILVVSAFISLFVSGICCGITCSDRVKVEETSTKMRINLDNPQNKDIELDINHG